MFQSVIGKNDIHFELDSATELPFTKCLSQNNYPSFRNLSQDQNTGLATPAYIGLGQTQNTFPPRVPKPFQRAQNRKTREKTSRR